MLNRGLRTLSFEVPDLAAAKKFYAQALGVEPYFDEPYYVGFDVGGYEVGLRPSEGKPASSTTYLASDDVDADLERMQQLGAKLREPGEDVGGGIRVGSVTDPSGNVLGFIKNPLFAPQLVAAGEHELSPKSFTVEATVKAPRAEVWRLWTSAEGLKWVVKDAKIELRPGGFYEWYFLLDRPAGSRGGEGCRVLSFVSERMLSFTWNAPPEQAFTRKLYTWVVVSFEDAGAGTKVSLTHTGWPRAIDTDARWQQTYAYFERAWGQVLQALTAHVNR